MAGYTLTEEGKKYLSAGLPEVRLAELLSSGPRSIDEAKKRIDSFSVALLWAKKNGWVAIENGQLRLVSQPKDMMHGKLKEVHEGRETDKESLSVLLSRRLVEEKRMTLEKQAQKLAGKEVTSLSRELIATGCWKDVKLKPYNVEAAAKIIHPGKKHHYAAFLDWVKSRMAALGFEEMRGPIIETEFWNMDALFMPQFHSARDIHGVYQLKNPKYADKLEDRWLEPVKAAHENGVAGSRGWGYKFDADQAHRLVMRSQGTALSARQLANVKVPGRYFSIARCFRPDIIDASHLPDFFQIEGIVVDEGLTFRHLIGILKMFAREFAGTDRIKLVPNYFPFTEPSVELVAYHRDMGWLELGGAGVFRPEVTKP
ncbi:MAG: phenylalanine--tRNA ligase subunit alpha, partial [Candidatus Aenigmarchaeota archaeon]|nr:phenylalanine--tRNA ligase subunit alpha [Candidatus Aenigmarchaeota archaeon]